GLLFGVLYWFNLPPVSLLFGNATATPGTAATPLPMLSTPTLVETAPLTGTGALSPTAPLSPTLSPAQRTLTPLGTPGASPTP
ncbi:MAG TPA: hypothetical protein VD886_04760, partial [Herpetosiphonaceae bacterium]|nr:hypothetical protein [Herpetosiphonaceae bacterium]